MMSLSPQKSNLHTHTSFGDGKNTPEEMVLAAIALGMETIGFSDHSFTPHDTSYCMTKQGTELYKAEIERLKRAYGDRIRIDLGIEMDYYADTPTVGYDYIIGSVHYIRLGDEHCVVDLSAKAIDNAVETYCDGEFLRYAKGYYQTVADLVNQTKCNVVGHFDLLSKFNEGGAMFDGEDPRYLALGYEAIDALLEREVVFEVNTGAISRGYRTAPYPSIPFLRRIREKGGRITLSSDAHHKDHLMYGFGQAIPLLKECGFSSLYTVARNGWEEIPLNF